MTVKEFFIKNDLEYYFNELSNTTSWDEHDELWLRMISSFIQKPVDILDVFHELLFNFEFIKDEVYRRHFRYIDNIDNERIPYLDYIFSHPSDTQISKELTIKYLPEFLQVVTTSLNMYQDLFEDYSIIADNLDWASLVRYKYNYLPNFPYFDDVLFFQEMEPFLYKDNSGPTYKKIDLDAFIMLSTMGVLFSESFYKQILDSQGSEITDFILDLYQLDITPFKNLESYHDLIIEYDFIAVYNGLIALHQLNAFLHQSSLAENIEVLSILKKR